MKKYLLMFLHVSFLWSCILMCNGSVAFAETAASYKAVPPFVTRGSDSNVMLDLSVETPMQGAAYNDQSATGCGGRIIDGGGEVGRCYSNARKYLGIFDPNKAYDYVGGRFVPVGSVTTPNSNFSTSNHYSGNFLNWATMTAIDEFRYALTGGRRTTDTLAETVIQRANMTLGIHSWYPVKMISSGTNANVAPSTVSPFTNAKIYIYSHGYQIDIGTSRGGHELAQNLNVQVKVCDSNAGLEANCVSYNNGAYYKPEGLIQNNANRMRFAAMSYSNDGAQSRGGGILRANMKYVGPKLPDGTVNPRAEYGINGIFINNPDAIDGVGVLGPDGITNSGVINYVNKFGAYGYKSYDPAGELFYECLNYFKHRGRTPEYAAGLSAPDGDYFPIITTWNDPIEHWCQHNYIVGINDANPWLDKKLPGTYFTASPFNGHALIGSDFGTPGNADPGLNVRTWTNTVGALEGLNGTSQCIGCTAVNCDMASNNKNIPGLGEVMGTCPSPGKENSYYIAGMAYYAHTQDIRSDLHGTQTISTFMIDTQEYNSNPLVGRMNMLWLTGKFGGFVEKNFRDTNTDGNINEPDLATEWDVDSDGVPDNYVLATDPEKLINGLTKVFDEISKRSSSATAASVISGSRSGEGAVYQSVFYPEYNDEASPRHTITWAGSVHASFVDDLGRMREDTPDSITGLQNGILDASDKIFAFRKLADGTTVVDKFNLVGSVAERTSVTLLAAGSLVGKYFLLNNVGEQFYVWFTVDGVGVDPRPSHDMTGISVALIATDTATMVATKTAAALHAYGAFNVPTPTVNTIIITNATPGATVPDATSGTSGVVISIPQQGAGDTTSFDVTGNAENINYLWNSNSYLNTIPDAAVISQRSYASTTPGRYIFTFIDADEDKIADSGEQLPFVATSLPPVTDLANASTIYPYIPIHSNSEALPSYVSTTGGNRNEFLQDQTQRVINYIRGQDQGPATLVTGTGGTIPAFRSRKLDIDQNGTLETWRLGDIVHSSPTVVSKPFEANHLLYRDASYATFAAKYANRRTVVYTGANDGMLHAFNGGFYEDRFDVFPVAPPAVPDRRADVQFLTQPKDKNGTLITTGFAAHPLGAELWAYIPYNLLPHLYWLTEPNYSHVYYADLKPRMFEAKIFAPETSCATNPNDSSCIHPGGWGTILVGGMRFGGGKINIDMNRTDGNVDRDDRTMTSAYYILDVTNPEAPPVVLGEISFPHLGYTTSYPTVATFKDKVETGTSPNAWYLIFGSGPAEADGSPGANPGESLSEAISKQSAKLYVVDLVEMASNKVLKTLDTTGTPSSVSPYYYKNFTGEHNAFISDPITVDTNLDYKAEAVYFGTVSYALTGTPLLPEWGGKLRRIVMKNLADPTLWAGDSVLIDLETNHHQPITAAPAVGLDPAGNTWVFFGTGRYLVRDDAAIADQQTYYGIKEPRVASATNPNILENSYAPVSRASLFNSTTIEVNAATHLVSGGAKPDGTTWTNATWTTFLSDTRALGGWYYNFTNSAERNVGQAALYGDLLTFTSYKPSDDICEYEGSSYLYAFYYLTGSAPFNTAIHDVTIPNPTNNLKMIFLGTGLVSKPSIHVGRNDGSTVFVQTSDGSIVTLKEENPGQTKSGKTSWESR